MQYNAEKMTLTIAFNSGIEKTYLEVPEEVFKKLSNSPEKDQFYAENIDAKFAVL